MVAVISKTGGKLMPTNEYRARKLLKKGKAVIHKYSPFTIQLTERETGETQPVELCVDTGYQHIGISVKSEKHEYLREQVDLLPNERRDMTTAVHTEEQDGTESVTGNQGLTTGKDRRNGCRHRSVTKWKPISAGSEGYTMRSP